MDTRVAFDFEIEFTNGGGIQGQDFRLDISGNDISDRELADYIVNDMRLLMVGKVNILNKYYVREPHKRKPINVSGTEKFIDLSHTIFDGLPTYKNLPPARVYDFLSREESAKNYEEGTSFHIGKVEIISSTGTYIDVPFHRYENGNDLSEIEIKALCDLEAITINAYDSKEIGVHFFTSKEIRNRAVLVHTGWSRYWNTPQYFNDHPFLTQEAAEYLRNCEVKLVGIDSHNIDDTRGRSRPVHTILLENNIFIVEHLTNLSKLPIDNYRFTAVPPKVKGLGTFLVRAFAKI